MAKTRRNRMSRKMKKGSRKASSWTQSVTRVYHELKRKDPNAKLRDAMKEASRRRKSGTL
jgi:hypothetical protein